MNGTMGSSKGLESKNFPDLGKKKPALKKRAMVKPSTSSDLDWVYLAKKIGSLQADLTIS